MPFQKDTRSTDQPGCQQYDNESPVRIYQVDARNTHDSSEKSSDAQRMGTDLPEEVNAQGKEQCYAGPHQQREEPERDHHLVHIKYTDHDGGDDDQVGNYPFFAVCQFQVAGSPVFNHQKDENSRNDGCRQEGSANQKQLHGGRVDRQVCE